MKKNCQNILKFPHSHNLIVRYAIKANPHKCLLQIIDKQGLHFDASSEYEVERCLLAGIKPEKIQLTSQQMPYTYWHRIINDNVFFNASSLAQLEEFGKRKEGGELSIRINPGKGSGHSKKTNVAGVYSSFGIWYENINKIKEITKKYNLKITKIHTHIGSGIDEKIWQEVAEMTCQWVKEFKYIHTVNLGGGFQVDRYKQAQGFNLDKIGKTIDNILVKLSKKMKRKLTLEIEPGTLIVAKSGTLICRIDDIINDKRQNEDINIIKLNTGMDIICRPTLYNSSHPIITFSKSSQQKKYMIVGHCCESSDVFLPETYKSQKDENFFLLPECNINDLILIEGVGAYCSSMSLKDYNSFPTANEFLLTKSNTLILIKKSLNITDFTCYEKPYS